jgi:hypothetical protein
VREPDDLGRRGIRGRSARAVHGTKATDAV